MRITRLFVLLALAALLAPRAEASRTSVWEPNPPASLTATRDDAAGPLASLAPSARLDTSARPDVETAEPPLFNLGDIVLADAADADAEHFTLGPLTLVDLNLLRGPPSSYPETRVRGFELLPPFRVGASPPLSLWERRACGSISCGLASDSRYDPWGLSERTMEMKEQACRVTGTGCPGDLGTVDPEALAREAAATLVEEMTWVGPVNGVSGALLGYDFVRKEKVQGPLARVLAGLSVAPGIPATIRRVEELPFLLKAAKYDLPGGGSGSVGEWVDGLKRWNSRSGKRSGLFEVEQTGPFNFRVHGGGEKVDIDGFLDTTILEAKFVDKPGVSPFVPGSGMEPRIRDLIQDKVRKEFQRLSAVISDPEVPFRNLEVRVNDPKAVGFFESLMAEYRIPGEVKVVDTAVKQGKGRR